MDSVGVYDRAFFTGINEIGAFIDAPTIAFDVLQRPPDKREKAIAPRWRVACLLKHSLSKW
jgi:hypothetical protein